MNSQGSLTNRLMRMGVVGLTALAAGCATADIKPEFFPKPGSPNTETYKDGKGKDVTVYRIEGSWMVSASSSGNYPVRIVRTGDTIEVYFEGTSTYVRQGERILTGTMVGNKMDCLVTVPGTNSVSGVGQITKDGTEFTCPSAYGGIATYSRPGTAQKK